MGSGAGEVFAVFTEDSAGVITCTLVRDPGGPESLITCTNGVITGTFRDFVDDSVTITVPNIIDISLSDH